MQNNSVNLSGYIYNPQEITTKSGKTITRFGMKVYAGKDSEGKTKYEFVNIKYFDKLPELKEMDMYGHLTVESYEKDGVTRKNITIIADNIKPLKEEKPQKEEVSVEDDPLPF